MLQRVVIKNVRSVMTRYNLTWSTSSAVRMLSTEVSTSSGSSETPLDIPPPSTGQRSFPPKIQSLVDEISRLSLMEVADLNDCLKKTLRIEAVPMGMGVATAPVASAKSEEAEDEAPKIVKSSFNVKLLKYEDSKKVPLIKEVKSIVEGMNLVQAKKFVESVPQILKTNISKDEAEKLKKTLEALGAVIQIE